jgi:hypothetical protein
VLLSIGAIGRVPIARLAAAQAALGKESASQA